MSSPNPVLERTGHSARFFASILSCFLRPAAYFQRSVALRATVNNDLRQKVASWKIQFLNLIPSIP